MYSLAPEKTLRLAYEPFYLAISISFYEIIKNDDSVTPPMTGLSCASFRV